MRDKNDRAKQDAGRTFQRADKPIATEYEKAQGVHAGKQVVKEVQSTHDIVKAAGTTGATELGKKTAHMVAALDEGDKVEHYAEGGKTMTKKTRQAVIAALKKLGV